VGPGGKAAFAESPVGIVGAGGTGSLSALHSRRWALANCACGQRHRRKENRHRTAGITAEYVGKPKVEALKAFAESVATAEPFLMETYEDWGTTEEGLRRLKDCDIVFCCVDKFAPRVPLNDLAYAHLIPVLDMASWMHPDKNKKIDALMTHAHAWSPGIPARGAVRR